MLTYKHSRKQVKSCIVPNDIFAFCVMCYQLDHDKQGSCLLSQEALPSTFTERHCNLSFYFYRTSKTSSRHLQICDIFSSSVVSDCSRRPCFDHFWHFTTQSMSSANCLWLNSTSLHRLLQEVLCFTAVTSITFINISNMKLHSSYLCRWQSNFHLLNFWFLEYLKKRFLQEHLPQPTLTCTTTFFCLLSSCAWA